MSALVKRRDLIESALELDPEKTALLTELNDLNRALHRAYMEFLTPLGRPKPSARAPSVFFDEEYVDGKIPSLSTVKPKLNEESISRQPRPLPAFEMGMNVAFCDHSAQLSGSGKVTRIIPSSSTTSHSQLGGLDPTMETHYEIQGENGQSPFVVPESTMWKTEGTMQRNNPSLNPSRRLPSTPTDVFTAQLTTKT
jgi:hypothetical protein